jgi:hypothetical protein
VLSTHLNTVVAPSASFSTMLICSGEGRRAARLRLRGGVTRHARALSTTCTCCSAAGTPHPTAARTVCFSEILGLTSSSAMVTVAVGAGGRAAGGRARVGAHSRVGEASLEAREDGRRHRGAAAAPKLPASYGGMPGATGAAPRQCSSAATPRAGANRLESRRRQLFGPRRRGRSPCGVTTTASFDQGGKVQAGRQGRGRGTSGGVDGDGTKSSGQVDSGTPQDPPLRPPTRPPTRTRDPRPLRGACVARSRKRRCRGSRARALAVYVNDAKRGRRGARAL